MSNSNKNKTTRIKCFMKIIKVVPLNNFTVEVYFIDGTIKQYNVSDKLNHPLFKPLNNESFFNKVSTDGYSINWGEDIEICGESIYNIK